MLKKVRIKNFLSCEDTEFDLEKITVLIGRNAAGKSNILKTIEKCSQFAVGNLSHLYLDAENHLENIFEINFFIEKNIFTYSLSDNMSIPETKISKTGEVNRVDSYIYLSEQLSLFENEKWSLIAERYGSVVDLYDNNKKTTFEIKNRSPLLSSTLAIFPDNKISPYIREANDYLSQINYYILENNEKDIHDYVISSDDYKHWLTQDIIGEKSVVMRLLDLWHNDKEVLNELQELAGHNGLNIIDKIEIEKTNVQSDYFYSIKFDNLRYSQLSDGTQRVLSILLALLYDKSTTLLIEQPEDGIHLGLLRKVLSICFEYAEVYNKQLIITTHSPEVINMFQPENVRLVKMTENGTKVTAFDKEQIPLIYDYLENEGALFDFIKSMNED
jgi:AAA15 family ATPase/GTPase